MKRILDIGDVAELDALGDAGPFTAEEPCACESASSQLVPAFFFGCVLGGALGMGVGALTGTWLATRKGAR